MKARSERAGKKVPSVPHRWQFRARFRRGAFGWKSQPAIQRVREAVREIQRVAKKDAVLAGEGAVLFLERVVPAIESVDGSSGGIGTAVNNAVRELAAILEAAPADERTRRAWLERLFVAFEEDRMPYLEDLGRHWGRMCATPAIASDWADLLLEGTRRYFGAPRKSRGYLKAAVPCLSALQAAGRHDEVIELLHDEDFWPFVRWRARALAASGRIDDALSVADTASGYDILDAYRVGEEILLAAGRVEEAYRRYGLRATSGTSYLACFREVARKYPGKEPAEILADFVARSPGHEGKWFATAKSLGLYDEAIALVQRSPCDPKTLARAARDLAEKEPGFAMEAGIAALRWIAEGHGYEINTQDVRTAFEHAMRAARNADREEQALERIREVLTSGSRRHRLELVWLRHQLVLSPPRDLP